MREIDVHPAARMPQIHGDEADDERDGGEHFEIYDRFQSHASDPRNIGHARDAVNHSAENNWRDQHADQFDKRVAEGLHLHAEAGIKSPEQYSGNHSEQHVDPKAGVPGLRGAGAFGG